MKRDLFSDVDALTGAWFSECRRWRYRLWRTWNPERPKAVFVMMNPSTADEVNNDPTVQRCQERTRMWAEMGFLEVGGVEVVNVFAWRETDSRKLPALIKAGTNIIGPGNDDAILTACKGAAIVVCGWGEPGHKLLQRGPKVLKLLADAGLRPHALAVNESGAPRHPLYTAYDVKPRALR